MNLEAISEVIKSREDLRDIKVIEETVFQGHQYQTLIECDLLVAAHRIPIVIAIPWNWERVLIDIYIQHNQEFPFIPHIDKKGKICLFELEGILIDPNLYGIISQALDRAGHIIKDGLAGTNKEEFIKEFDSYWLQLPDIRYAKCDLPESKKISLMKYGEKTIAKRKKEKYSDYLLRLKAQRLYVSQKPQDLQKYYQNNENITIKNALYIPIELHEFLLPPDPRLGVKREYVQKLLNLVNVNKHHLVFNKLGSTKFLIFSCKQPNRTNVVLGVVLEECEILAEDENYVIKSVDKVIPIFIDRVDKQYLMTRSNEIKNSLSEKRVLLIGCGSIGGYIATELVKAGIEKMMLVDSDYLYETNIFRHVLGLEYVNQYKSVALQSYLVKNIPNLRLSSLEETIEEAVLDGEIEFEQYDIIISATGNHNVNRWINQYMYERKLEIPVIYAWNEVLGIGNHVAYIKYGNPGCYECFLGRNDETGELYDRTSYCDSGQDVVKRVAGCGSAFIPYGSTVSLKTAAVCVDTVKKIHENRYTDNMIISIKGDDYYFLKAGLKVTKKYLNQKDNITEYSGTLFANSNCECCGVKNGCSN